MYFKTYGYNTMAQALLMISDLKTGHYLKVPPRGIFAAQMTGTIVGAIINYSLMVTIIDHQRDILLDPNGSNIWSGASPQTVNSAAITWGAIGPIRMFGPGTPYTIILWSLLIGFFLPIPIYLLHRRFPKVGFEYINIPIITQSMSLLPGVSSSFVTTGIVVSFISQYYLIRYKPKWLAETTTTSFLRPSTLPPQLWLLFSRLPSLAVQPVTRTLSPPGGETLATLRIGAARLARNARVEGW